MTGTSWPNIWSIELPRKWLICLALFKGPDVFVQTLDFSEGNYVLTCSYSSILDTPKVETSVNFVHFPLENGMIFNQAQQGPRWPTPPCHADHAAGTSDDGVEKRACEAVGYGFKHGLTMFQKPTGGLIGAKWDI